MKDEKSGTMVEEIIKIKEEANEFFKSGDHEQAIKLCNSALGKCKDDNLTCVLHKNAAASHLKLKEFDEAIKHCDLALELKPQDAKALYRRACALEALERYEEAYRDAQRALVSSPPDAATFKPLLSKLLPIVEQRRQQSSQTRDKAIRMIRRAFGEEPNLSDEDIETALNNIIVLARERAGVEALLEVGLLRKIKSLLEIKRPSKKELKWKILAVRSLSQLVQFDMKTCLHLGKELGVPFVMNLQDITYGFSGDAVLAEEALSAVQYLWQSILNSLSGSKKGEKPDPECLKINKSIIDSLLTTMTMSLNSRSITGEARDMILQIFTKNIDYVNLNWADKFVEIHGLQKLADIGAEVPELKIESAMTITPNTRGLLSVLMTRIYNNMYYDKARETYVAEIDDFLKELLISPDMDSKVRVIALITVLLNGPVDVGNTFIGRQGVIQMTLVMANSETYLEQRVATEAIVAAASKKDKAKSIINDGINILKRLYQSKNDEIKVRALVGLCKLGSSSGTDASWRPFQDGSTLKLAEACRRFLLNPAKDVSVQRWAVEGLSYLTLDGEVKEKLIEDLPALKTMLEISSHAEKLSEIVYPIIMTLVNLCNAYDKKEIDPEMLELAKFAKHHVPEEHEFDDPDFVVNRVEVLAKIGVTNCLVNLAKATESASVLELISRILNAICERKELRGMVVAHGGARELIRIFEKSNPQGKSNSAQALARIGVTTAPSIAFPGQRTYEAVKPLLYLLDMERSGLENFEALLALCNIAGESESCRRRIFDEKGFMMIEHYAYEKHTKLRMAAVQCMCNLALSEECVKAYEGENERVKFMVLLCAPSDDLGMEDTDEIDTMKAAASVLAILTSQSRKVCGRVLSDVKDPFSILMWLVANPMLEFQLRGVTIVLNIIKQDKDLAERIVGSPLFELIMVLSRQGDIEPPKELSKEDVKNKADIKQRCNEALRKAEDYGLIKKS
ncbi:protein unc-45 homolog B isoform X2 [Folsomia candida]|uniref:protein unc-45 homolog B isoform X2 n=1 Tax=Folsomia candida TaxID=158441 RepID=UPI000B8EF266|nr:protein unc-45 homolog B isoform X2 [Folsomia candida]